VIQLQKFNGKNSGNNEVIVDFKERKVDFREIKGIGFNRVDNRISGLIHSSYIRIAIIFFFANTAVHLVVGRDVSANIWALIFLYFGFKFISPIIDFMFKKLDKDNELLPKANAFLIGMNRLLKGKKPFESLRIFPQDLIDNEFIIPKFDNVMFNYKLNGDFAEFIDRIEIKAIMPSNPYEFSARIIFNKKIKKGSMIIKYI